MGQKIRVLFNPTDRALMDPLRLNLPNFLQKAGYHTACIGKWHLGADWVMLPKNGNPDKNKRSASWQVDYAQPFENGPVDVGFDEAFFILSSLDMAPYVYLRNNRAVAVPTVNKGFPHNEYNKYQRIGAAAKDFEASNCLADWAAESRSYIQRRVKDKSRKPFFLYLPLTSPHTPITPGKAFKGMYKQYSWYADFMAETDWVVAQVLEQLKQSGLDDDTIVIFTSDNGFAPYVKIPKMIAAGYRPSGPYRGAKATIYEGGHRVPFIVRWPGKVAAGSTCDVTICTTDFFATFAIKSSRTRRKLGGIRQNMAISWPARIKDTGGLRGQFCHVIDIVPTILEATGIPAPEAVDGIKQAPIEGTSLVYTFDAKNAKEPSRHKTQYFEMMGQWALYHEGWLLSTKVNRAPWEAFGAANPDPLNNQVLELYDLTKDFSQSQNLADKFPDKVKEMKELFIEEAKKYQVFPMDASVATRLVAPRPNITAGRTEFVYTRPMVGLPQGDSPSILNSSYTITADIEVPEGGAEGMILTSGGRFAGYGFYLLQSKPVFLWNMVDLERIKWEGPKSLAPGKHTVEFNFKYDGLGVGTLLFNNMSGLGRPGTGTLKVDGKVVATQKMKKTLPMILQWDESFDIGSDTLTGVNDADYQPPFTFTGKLDKLTIKVDRPKLSPEDIKRLQAATRNNKASE